MTRTDAAGIRPTFMRVAALAVTVGLVGCRAAPPVIHPTNDRTDRFQALRLDLGDFRSPEERTGGHDRALTVAVSISGGGHRATNFGVGALLGLEEIVGPATNALMEVDYLSTVSGGGLAAAAYVVSRHDFQRFGGDIDEYRLADCVAASPGDRACGDKDRPIGDGVTDPCLRHHLERSYLNALGLSFLSWRAIGPLDRGDFLERRFDDDILGHAWRLRVAPADEDVTFRLDDVFLRRSDDTVQLVPHWVCNATVFENGAIFPVTPDILIAYGINRYTHRTRTVQRDPDQTVASFADRVPYALAMTASGSVPVAIPATTIICDLDPDRPNLHLLDGGVADNLGVTTAVDLLDQDPDSPAGRRRVMIVVDAFAGARTPFSSHEGSPTASDVVGRFAEVGLDTWRGRSRAYVRDQTAHRNPDGRARAIFVSFDELEGVAFEDLYGYAGFSDEDRESIRRSEHLPPDAGPDLYAREIATSYDIEPEGQRFLLSAGRYVVKMQEAEIRRLLWNEPSDRLSTENSARGSPPSEREVGYSPGVEGTAERGAKTI